jgi:hypothetical protein
MKTKFGLSQYRKPTPAKWRKLGDSLLAVSAFVVAFTVGKDGMEWLEYTALAIGVAGKFLTNMFTEE